jgi:hypothetical protein
MDMLSLLVMFPGCVMAEMLGMTMGGLGRSSRLPLFPGTSCLPLSRGTSIGALTWHDVWLFVYNYWYALCGMRAQSLEGLMRIGDCEVSYAVPLV